MYGNRFLNSVKKDICNERTVAVFLKLHLIKKGDIMFKPIETSRLAIREFKETDLMTLYQYRKDEEVAKYQSWNPTNFLDTMKLLHAIIGTPFHFKKGSSTQLVVELSKTKEHIGDVYIGIDEFDSNKCYIGYTLARNYWGHGYGSEAVNLLLSYLFNQSEIKEVHALILPANKRSIHLIKKLGFISISGIEYCLYKPHYYNNRNNMEKSYP